MGQLSSEEYAKNVGGKGTAVTKKMCTSIRAQELGCKVNGTYSNNQIVERAALTKNTVTYEKVIIVNTTNHVMRWTKYGSGLIEETGEFQKLNPGELLLCDYDDIVSKKYLIINSSNQISKLCVLFENLTSTKKLYSSVQSNGLEHPDDPTPEIMYGNTCTIYDIEVDQGVQFNINASNLIEAKSKTLEIIFSEVDANDKPILLEYPVHTISVDTLHGSGDGIFFPDCYYEDIFGNIIFLIIDSDQDGQFVKYTTDMPQYNIYHNMWLAVYHYNEFEAKVGFDEHVWVNDTYNMVAVTYAILYRNDTIDNSAEWVDPPYPKEVFFGVGSGYSDTLIPTEDFTFALQIEEQ